jgi:TonB family protein
MHALMLAIVVTLGQTGSSGPDQIYRPGSGVTMPRLLKDVKPEYTEEARRGKIQGSVMLECVVLVDGTPSRIRVVRALDAGLDQSAIKALEQWRFAPGMKDGVAVPVVIQAELTFSLGGPTRVTGGTAITVVSRTELDGSHTFFDIVEERFRRLPAWNPATVAEPPLSTAEAVKIANEHLRAAPHSGVADYVLLGVSLQRIGGRTSDRWSYQLTFAPMAAADVAARGTVMVVVLFDRTTIEPRSDK